MLALALIKRVVRRSVINDARLLVILGLADPFVPLLLFELILSHVPAWAHVVGLTIESHI